MTADLVTRLTNDAEAFDAWQSEVYAYVATNFGTGDPETSVLNLVEEVGELCRALLKRRQGIRGSYEEWTAEVAKELGDVLLSLLVVAEAEGASLLGCAMERWGVVSRRDWSADRVQHGIPDDNGEVRSDG